MDGQRLAFQGYAPIDPSDRARQLKAWEQMSKKHEQTQILIETPYRNEAMLETLKQTLQATTRLCVARSLTTPEEWVQAHAVSRWKSMPAPDLARKPAIFLFQAAR